MSGALSRIVRHPQFGLLIIIVLLMGILTAFAGTHVGRTTGQPVNNFLNPGTLMQVATDTSAFAIMAIGMTMVIISAGIDLSVGSTYALAGVLMGIVLRGMPGAAPLVLVLTGLGVAVGIGVLCGLLNGAMVAKLGVHPFIITLGTMWIFRGTASVVSKAESILVPDALTRVTKANLGLRPDLYPVPLLVMLAVTLAGSLYLGRTVPGRRIYAVGGNEQAARYAGIRIGRVLTGVYVVSGMLAGLSAFVGCSYFGASSSADSNGYELYVVASAVVGGCALTGGKGSALGALLGALLIVLIRQSIRTLGFDQNYEYIIVGAAIVIAVVANHTGTRLQQRRLARAAEHGTPIPEGNQP